jgi:hypothetical protein
MLEWLQEDVTDDVTRSLDAVSKLQEIRQKDGQTFHQFQEEYSAIEEELPYKLPAMYRVCAFLNSLKYDLRRQIISIGVPKTHQDLIAAVKSGQASTGPPPTSFHLRRSGVP